MYRIHFTQFIPERCAHTIYIRTLASNSASTCRGGKNLNSPRDVVAEIRSSVTGPVGSETKSEEVVVKRTIICRHLDQEEWGLSGKTGENLAKATPDTFRDSDSPSDIKLTGSWSRAGMLSSEYETVNKEEEPYGRKEGVKDDLRYGCMEKYRKKV